VTRAFYREPVSVNQPLDVVVHRCLEKFEEFDAVWKAAEMAFVDDLCELEPSLSDEVFEVELRTARIGVSRRDRRDDVIDVFHHLI